MLIKDTTARMNALSPEQSFIVQAPAGSGKTELLTQRFLTLLSHVEQHPEEIVAITFTQKAAHEMRERILSALEFAQSHPEPEAAHKKVTWHRAKAALTRSKKMQWRLLDNPKRIRVMTIDALCLSLTQSAPLLSELGAQPTISQDATELYQQSVRMLLSLNENSALMHRIETLLLHIDNRVEYLSELLSLMLKKRDQWLPTLFNASDQHQLKEQLENTLQDIAEGSLNQLKRAMPNTIKVELIQLAQLASQTLNELDHNPLSDLNLLHDDCQFYADELPVWKTVAHWLLTQSNQWRTAINKNQGFPPGAPNKKRMALLLEELKNHPKLQDALIRVRQCPPIEYTGQQWNVLEALLTVLPALVACLRVVMQQRSEVDFLETTLAALRALGDEDHPTDLALYLDYQIHHLLIDEFQDTSTIQYQLFEKLVSQWNTGDNRSLFLVGDPMQSIYRFRNAEVGLFIRAKEKGLAQLPLQFIQLECNFRSAAAIVDWCNTSFAQIMPKEDSITTGAIKYSPAIPTHSGSGEVQYYASSTRHEGAQQVIDILQQLPTSDSIAILVRSRSQLNGIIEQLQSRHIPFSAIDINPLFNRPEIRDLFQLTNALLHFDDKIAWLSVLRAPFCGLTLADLHTLCQLASQSTLPNTLLQPDLMLQLSPDGQQRVQHLRNAIEPAIQQLGRMPLSERIPLLWTQLKADAFYLSEAERNNCQNYFDLLLELEGLESCDQCLR